MDIGMLYKFDDTAHSAAAREFGSYRRDMVGIEWGYVLAYLYNIIFLYLSLPLPDLSDSGGIYKNCFF